MTEAKTLTITLAPEVHDELQALADDDEITLAELFRRAVALHKFASAHRMVPAGASLVPNHWLCRLRWHRALSWTQHTPSG